jgi:hypothetical protein
MEPRLNPGKHCAFQGLPFSAFFRSPPPPYPLSISLSPSISCTVMRTASRKASNHGDLRPIWADVGTHRPRGVGGNERLMFDTSRVQPARSIHRDHKPGDSRSDTEIFSLPSIHLPVGTVIGCDDRRAQCPAESFGASACEMVSKGEERSEGDPLDIASIETHGRV